MDKHCFSNCNNSFREYRKHPIPAVAELITTEETYINTLGNVVYGYMTEYFNESSEIPVPRDLQEHDGLLIFGNITEIYEWHKHYFFGALKKNELSIRGLSQVFIQNEPQFHIYAKYINNKSISEYLINTHFEYFEKIKKALKHKHSIGDLMIAPVQRVGRYKMLLNEILKHLKKKDLIEDANCLNDAITVIGNVCNEVNEFGDLTGIRNFDGIVSAQGQLLHRGFLKCNYDGKRRNLYVFLFKRSILFTKKIEPKKKYTIPTYNSCLQIPMNKLQLKELTNSKFFLQLMDPNAPNCSLICEAHSREEHKKWVQVIKQRLSLQMNLINDLVHPTNDDDDEREMLL
ncbi:rho guanine nucleotide exchange factor 25-like [Calliphora vicina]|uniref:rho guanine nucleotide exchange factor 25-like n=1 Tax=Calliphora vicina TaxID=7373 RepID=UPI00325C05D6